MKASLSRTLFFFRQIMAVTLKKGACVLITLVLCTV